MSLEDDFKQNAKEGPGDSSDFLPSSAKRYNTGKPRMGLLPADALEEMAGVLTMGADKYGENNWRKGLPFIEVVDSLERHVSWFKKGHDLDDESGYHHMAHVMCNAAFLIQYLKDELYHLDDRYRKEENK